MRIVHVDAQSIAAKLAWVRGCSTGATIIGLRELKALCLALMLVAPRVAGAQDAREVVIWVHADRAPARFQKSVGQALQQAVDGEPRVRSHKPDRATERKLARLARTCKPVGDAKCIEQAAELVSGRALLVLALKGKAPFDARLVWLADGATPLEVETSLARQGAKDAVKRQWAALATLIEKQRDNTDAVAAVPMPPLLPPPPPEWPSPPEDALATAPVDPALTSIPEPAPEPGSPTASAPASASGPASTSSPDAPPPASDSDPAPAQDPAPWGDPNDPVLLHAEALLVEADGDPNTALTVLRTAYLAAEAQRIPELHLIQADLARLSYETHSPELATDSAGLLSRAPDNEDERLLMAYIQLRLGDRAAAQQTLASADVSADSEASALRAALTPAPQNADDKWWLLGLRLKTEVDSNVTVLPQDAPSQQVGLRLGLDLFARLSPVRGALRLDVEAMVSYAPHLNDRDVTLDPNTPNTQTLPNLKQYDVASGMLTTRLTYAGDGWQLRAVLDGTQVLLNPLESSPPDANGRDYGHFMQSLRLWTDVVATFDSFYAGGFVSGAYRDFIYQNPESVPGVDRALDDRDGPALQAGALAGWSGGGLSVSTQLAGLAELAEGRRQRVRGGRALLYASYQWRELSVSAGVDYTARHYPRARNAAEQRSSKRWDHRVTPFMRIAYQLNERFAVFGSYAYINNTSNQDFGYDRHLGTLGAEAQW